MPSLCYLITIDYHYNHHHIHHLKKTPAGLLKVEKERRRGVAELMAVDRGTAEAIGLQALFRNLGTGAKIAVRSDATAAIGIVARVGLGKVRHLAVADLWVQ